MTTYSVLNNVEYEELIKIKTQVEYLKAVSRERLAWTMENYKDRTYESWEDSTMISIKDICRIFGLDDYANAKVEMKKLINEREESSNGK